MFCGLVAADEKLDFLGRLADLAPIPIFINEKDLEYFGKASPPFNKIVGGIDKPPGGKRHFGRCHIGHCHEMPPFRGKEYGTGVMVEN